MTHKKLLLCILAATAFVLVAGLTCRRIFNGPPADEKTVTLPNLLLSSEKSKDVARESLKTLSPVETPRAESNHGCVCTRMMNNASSSSTLLLSSPKEDFPSQTIFFLETSGLPFLSPKQLCAVESAAYHNRHRPIVVAATTKYLMLTSQLQNILDQYTNIQIVHLDIAAWVSGTKLEPWLAKGLLDKSKFRVSHTSDTLRYVTLFKYGGVYLDMDLIVLRSLDGFKDGIGLEDDGETANGAVMAFDKGHPVMDMCMEGILQHFDGTNWASYGPGLLSKILKEWCGLPRNEILLPQTCNGVHVHDKHIFYPVHYSQWNSLYEDNADTSKAINASMDRSLLIHYWNKFSAAVPIKVGSWQPLAVFASKNCPVVATDPSGILWGYEVL